MGLVEFHCSKCHTPADDIQTAEDCCMPDYWRENKQLATFLLEWYEAMSQDKSYNLQGVLSTFFQDPENVAALRSLHEPEKI